MLLLKFAFVKGNFLPYLSKISRVVLNVFYSPRRQINSKKFEFYLRLACVKHIVSIHPKLKSHSMVKIIYIKKLNDTTRWLCA